MIKKNSNVYSLCITFEDGVSFKTKELRSEPILTVSGRRSPEADDQGASSKTTPDKMVLGLRFFLARRLMDDDGVRTFSFSPKIDLATLMKNFVLDVGSFASSATSLEGLWHEAVVAYINEVCTLRVRIENGAPVASLFVPDVGVFTTEINGECAIVTAEKRSPPTERTTPPKPPTIIN